MEGIPILYTLQKYKQTPTANGLNLNTKQTQVICGVKSTEQKSVKSQNLENHGQINILCIALQTARSVKYIEQIGTTKHLHKYLRTNEQNYEDMMFLSNLEYIRSSIVCVCVCVVKVVGTVHYHNSIKRTRYKRNSLSQ